MATFDPNRVRPGTIELVRAADGTYTTKVVGLESINSLSLPDISTTAAVTKTDTDTKTATDITGDTVQSQTQKAFQTGGDNQPDTTGDMLQEAKKTSGMLSDTFANTRSLMTSDDAYRGVDNRFDAEKFDETEEKVSIKDPTEKVFGKSTDDVDYVDAIRRGEVGTKFVEKPKIGDDLFKPGPAFDDKGTPFARPDKGTVDQMAADAIDRQEMISGATADDATANTLGISADTTQSATRAAKEAGFASGSFPGRTSTRDAKEADFASGKFEPKRSALETVSTSLRSAFKDIKTPMMAILETVVGPESTDQQHAKSYFTDRGDGRIGGNPATNLYAGMNRVSATGNLFQAGRKRIERREKTAATKDVSDKFKADTEKMKQQEREYLQDKASKRDARLGNTKTNVTGFGKTGLGRDKSNITGETNQGGDTGSNKKIVCTMMNQRYGFGSFRNKIWLRFHKDYSPEYQKGYHRVFLPLVNIAKKEGLFNTVVRKILEHMGRHVTADMFQVMRNKKSDKLGRLYRKIFEPICYWLGGK